MNYYLILILISSLIIIVIKNPIISVLFLILVSFFSIFISINFGVEFLALLILIVYVGAISVLFPL